MSKSTFGALMTIPIGAAMLFEAYVWNGWYGVTVFVIVAVLFCLTLVDWRKVI